MRIFAIAIAFLLLNGCASTNNTIHVTGERAWAKVPTIPEGMKQRVEASAIEFQAHAPVPRIALFDIAFPATAAEFQSTGGYAVLLLTALSQEKVELPPRRLYVALDGKQHALELISTVSAYSEASPLVASVLGSNRWDALYGFPVYLMQDGAQLTMDFSANRDGFVLGTFSTADRDVLGYEVPDGGASVTGQASDSIMEMVAREYPGFLSRAP
jgi:hypothetical protein